MKFEEDVEFVNNVIFNGDVVFKKNAEIRGTLTAVNIENKIVYKEKELKTKWDLFKALIGI